MKQFVVSIFAFLSSLVPASLLLVSGSALAFPEMVRHGYGNCTSCHISPAGGGILTNYGRELSKEVLTTWSGEREHLPLNGAVELPKSLRLGGDFRSIQTYRDTPEYREGKYFLMQADVEAAWVTDRLTLVGSFGRDPGSPLTKDDDKWLSRRHYALVPIGKTMSVRAGRFLRNFGLMIPDHTSEIRRGLGWNQSSETYNAEFNYQTDEYTLAVTGVSGRPDDSEVISEKGVAVNASRFIQPGFKVGGSYFYGKTTDRIGREIYGLYWALGFNERTYWLGEFDWSRTAPENSDLIEGWVSYNRVGYEVYKGIDFYLVHETRKSDRRVSELDSHRYGPGFQWAPRPHLILTGQWEKQVSYTQSRKAIDLAWLIFQYYI